MKWNNFSPAVLTLLIFLLVQGFGSLLLFLVGILISPELKEAVLSFLNGATQDLPMFEQMPVSVFSLILIVVDLLAVLACYFFLHNICPKTVFNLSSIKWRPGLIAVVGGVLGALSISILTETVELPDVMMQMSLAMSHNFVGLLALVIIGPITEELIFREAIEGEMLRRGTAPWIAILTSALAFGLAHLNLAQGLYAFPLAILFGIIYYKTGNIVLTSLLHIINNGVAAIQLYTLGEEIEDISYADLLGGPLWAYTFMLLLGLFSIILMTMFYKHYPSHKEIEEKSYLL